MKSMEEIKKMGLIEKVNLILNIASNKSGKKEELTCLKELASEHSSEMILGKVFGYSVSDYALASLYWIGSEESQSIYRDMMNEIGAERQEIIKRLIDLNYYKAYITTS